MIEHRNLRILALAAALLTSGCGLCGNVVNNRFHAPDNSVEVVFTRDCGATTDFSTQASIGEINAGTGNRAGNIFIASTGRGDAPVGPGGGPELRVRWLDARTVELAYHKKAQVDYDRVVYSTPRADWPGTIQVEQMSGNASVRFTDAKTQSSPQRTASYAMQEPDTTKPGPWTTVIKIVGNQARPAQIVIRITGHISGGVRVHWLNENLLWLQVWRGRVSKR